jgi:hypothetical protein
MMRWAKKIVVVFKKGYVTLNMHVCDFVDKFAII